MNELVIAKAEILDHLRYLFMDDPECADEELEEIANGCSISQELAKQALDALVKDNKVQIHAHKTPTYSAHGGRIVFDD